jgi:hypothetical protein
VAQEYEAAFGVLALTIRLWPTLHDASELNGITFSVLRSTRANLEGTYTVRLFAEFEGILRDQYPHSRPGRRIPGNSEALLSGLGAHYRIPVEARQRVHRVRLLRHSLAHANPGAQAVPIIDAVSWLSTYLSFIPDEEVP